jgi:hypothetical protein
MKFKQKNPKHDCFAIDKNEHCTILEQESCKGCNFYKTVAQDIADMENSKKVLNRHLGMDVREYEYEDVLSVIKAYANRCSCGTVIPKGHKKCPVCEKGQPCISGRTSGGAK